MKAKYELSGLMSLGACMTCFGSPILAQSSMARVGFEQAPPEVTASGSAWTMQGSKYSGTVKQSDLVAQGGTMRMETPIVARAQALAVRVSSSVAQQEDPMLAFRLAYTGESWGNIGGQDGPAMSLHNLDIDLTADLESLTGWRDATLFVYGLGNQGDSPSHRVGDIQGLSNIDAPTTFKLYEMWLEQRFLQDRLSVRAGLYDLNSEFDAIETAGMFLNSSHGIGPDFSQSGLNGPSIFPTTSLGLRLWTQPREAIYAQAVVLDGVSGDPHNSSGTHIKLDAEDGALITTEIGYSVGALDSEDGVQRRVAIGAWAYTAPFDDLLETDSRGQPVQHRALPGLYVLAEWKVFHESMAPVQGLSLFARYGRADAHIYQIGQYLGVGALYTGLIPRRDSDQVGIAVAHIFNGEEYRRAQLQEGGSTDLAEIAVELSYRLGLLSNLILRPDIQYIINPGTDPDMDNVLVVGARLELLLEGATH